MPAKIQLKPNGPILVSGPIEVTDPTGVTHTVPEGKNIALCRCGQSKTRPSCDGTHKSCGFSATEPLPKPT